MISKVGWICGGNREANTSRMERGNEGGPNKEAGVNKYRLAWHCGFLENSPITALGQLSFGDSAALFDGSACPWFSSPQDGIYIYALEKAHMRVSICAYKSPPTSLSLSLIYIYSSLFSLVQDGIYICIYIFALEKGHMRFCVRSSVQDGVCVCVYIYMRSEKPICGSIC